MVVAADPAVLDWINQVRESYGLPTLAAISSGEAGMEASCPLANSLSGQTPDGKVEVAVGLHLAFIAYPGQPHSDIYRLPDDVKRLTAAVDSSGPAGTHVEVRLFENKDPLVP
jgi:hypothetical protein